MKDTRSRRGLEDQPGEQSRIATRIMAGLTQGLDWFDNSLQNVLASLGFAPLHRTQSMILLHIALGIDRPADIAREMGLTRQNVHHMARSLIDAGMIESAPDPDDPRRNLYRLSEQASELRTLAISTMAELEQVLEQRIGSRRVTALRKALEADWGPEIENDEELRKALAPRKRS
jgi:DNA-binding MarR family transcriptional regulator